MFGHLNLLWYLYIFQLSFPNSDKSLERQSQLENDVIEELIASKLLFRKEVK